ncbi:Kinesin- motor protein [Coemansia aciculifera]|uniref:Kinesin- motor protein n=1 Tax=Coemansia aciculifera TaxID=417176 RepID=A0ACC1M3H1_9FUNG|nr:Kinesin- motor protein [Coemansia aciculifera]
MTTATFRQTDSAQEKGTNIKVFVRCCDVQLKGTMGNSAPGMALGKKSDAKWAVSVNPVFGSDVQIMNSSSATLKHPYDGVFGPQATQEQVYDKVAQPILDEVIQGYSCTIFAYGQTGTGKTYTMQGGPDQGNPEAGGMTSDPLSISPTSADAGLIPRTLYHLFYLLDRQSVEYEVTVSYVELYKEKVYDLLDSRSYGDGNGNGLNLLDDRQRVVIQNLEEKRVMTAQAAVELLREGAERRRVAATQCNKKSSRSHAIYTIKVDIREPDTTGSGQIILKVGKLNLVDLAGSENVGQSGANAHETSSINKSLLALGQVITAVSERSTHIPYRVSKLTRILCDSLGGHTQTCMIATINLASGDTNEAKNTLQYATRARGITNKPTITRNVVRADIVNGMQAKIDRLLADLEAARKSEGHYVTHETYKELSESAATAQAKSEAWKQRVDLLEAGLAKARADAEAMAASYEQLNRDKTAVDDALQESRVQQQQLAGQLRTESLFTRAHAHHEQALGVAAHQLRSDLLQARSEGALLHSKTVQLAKREHLNVEAAARVSHQAQADSEMVLAQVSALGVRVADSIGALLDTLESRIGPDFERNLTLNIGAHTSKLRSELERVSETYRDESGSMADSIRTALEAADVLSAGVEGAVKAAVAEVGSICAAQAANARASQNQLSEELRTLTTVISQALDAIRADAHAAQREAVAQSERYMQQIQAAALEEQRLSDEHIVELERQIEAMQAKALQSDEVFMQMLAQRREENAAMSAALVKSAAASAETRNSMRQALVDRHGESIKQQALSAEKLHASTAAAHDVIARHMADGTNAAESAIGALVRNIDDHHIHIQTRLAATLHTASDAHFESASKHAAISQGLSALGKTGVSAVQLASTTATNAASRYSGTIEEAVASLNAARSNVEGLARSQIDKFESSIAAVSADIANVATTVQQSLAEGVKALEPSAQIPTRSATQHNIASWNVTLPHDAILDRLAANEHSSCLDWTGKPVCLDEVTMADSGSTTDVEPMDVVRPETPTGAPRKRPSDSVISPRTDADSKRPTRRQCTRTARDHSVSTAIDENDPPISTLTSPSESDLKLVSAIPMPPRTRARSRN